MALLIESLLVMCFKRFGLAPFAAGSDGIVGRRQTHQMLGRLWAGITASQTKVHTSLGPEREKSNWQRHIGAVVMETKWAAYCSRSLLRMRLRSSRDRTSITLSGSSKSTTYEPLRDHQKKTNDVIIIKHIMTPKHLGGDDDVSSETKLYANADEGLYATARTWARCLTDETLTRIHKRRWSISRGKSKRGNFGTFITLIAIGALWHILKVGGAPLGK